MRTARRVIGLALLVVACGYLVTVVDAGVLAKVLAAVAADPLGLLVALACYALAFDLRARAWRRMLPGLAYGHSWAALHVSLLGNHVLPFRLGEALRVTSVLRRTDLPAGPVTATAVTSRVADLLSVVLLALVAVPGLVLDVTDPWVWALLAGLVALGAAAVWWVRRLRLTAAQTRTRSGERVRLPGGLVVAAAVVAWVLESAVVWEIARTAGVPLAPLEAVAVTAVTIVAQAVAVTPGGFGSYEAAATAALTGLGVPTGQAFAIALATHAVKTVYALLVGGVALLVPAPTYWGLLRLPRTVPPRPTPWPIESAAPVVAIMPVHNEQDTVGEVVRRLPETVHGRPVQCVVVDDGSSDGSAERAADAGAHVVRHGRNLGLGAAVRRGLAEATKLRPAAVVYLDADGEYQPEELARLAEPVLTGGADYVIGSRFAGDIRRMHAHRRLGNVVLTWWVRWLTRRRDVTDGQSGYRAFSARAAAEAEIVHDYNYAQVLTLDLLAKGYTYTEVPITYAFRESGRSFVRLGRYLRKVVPAVHRELNGPGFQSSTTWAANRSRAADHATSSNPRAESASTAS
ncbi:lysylphosphatidylglycerol synthase domain-containing protein [Actinopolymorpha sp. B11F2]|uniref:lysylphosphatidylglycerol synthase domain-containing protein n=1 Tax=Actinopolymorpha sp. B11F2 TaxID=3160862 RepID=UPI0032E5022C